DWLEQTTVAIEDLSERETVRYPQASVERRQRTFGYTDEELRILLGPMAAAGTEPLGAMGTDTPVAAFAERPRLLFDYFAQSFAQVTNPPLDAIREEIVTSVAVGIGSEGNLLAAGPQDLFQVDLPYPVIDHEQLAKFVHLSGARVGSEGRRATAVLRGLYRPGGGDALRARIAELCEEASAAIRAGARFLVLSDRDSHADLAPIPTPLLTSAVHHHLIRERTRTAVSLLVEAGDVREVHHVATLIGFGASAVNPYLAMETAALMVRDGRVKGIEEDVAVRNVLRSLGRGLLKV